MNKAVDTRYFDRNYSIPFFVDESELPDVGFDFKVSSGATLSMITEVRKSEIIQPERRGTWVGRTLWGEFKPVTEKGLFAVVDFNEGDFVGVYEGLVVDADYIDRNKMDYKRVMWFGLPLESKGVLGKNNLVYANHVPESDANIRFSGFNAYAAKPIKAGEEMAWSYGPGNWEGLDSSRVHVSFTPNGINPSVNPA